MRRFITVLSILIIVCLLSSCSQGTYEEGYEAGLADGYKEGYTDGCTDGFSTGYRAAQESLSSESISSDEFIDKYLGDDYIHTSVSEPISGTILYGKEYPDSEITVTADSSSSYVVSLKDINENILLSFYVRAGETVTVGVPSQGLYVYFASGTTWYGYGKGLMFGENTIYSKDDELLDFTEYTWEYTLYPVYDGNFSETPSNESDFFE